MLKRYLSLALVACVVFGLAPASHAALERVGPVTAATAGYPAWYQDQTGLGLEFCTPVNQSEFNGGWCTILPGNVPTGAAPEVPFTNFSDEHFYWTASAGSRTTGLLVLALEGAFATGAIVPGDQIVFGRVRISIPSLPLSGDYSVYTPFGDFLFRGLTAGNRLFFTSDIGITCGTDFSCALNSQIGPFLLPSATPGGVEVPPIPDLIVGQDPFYDSLVATGGATPYPGTGKRYIADPARIGPVTGSPLPPFTSPADGQAYDHNRFRIEVNDGVNPTSVLFDEVNFVLAGRVTTALIPGRVTIKRASYSQSATGTKLDVFATAFPTAQGRLPGSPVPPAVNPDLGFYPAPCATDPVTGAVIGPPIEPGLLYQPMYSDGAFNWWGQTAPAVVPPQVCVQDHNARDAFGNVAPAFFLGDVADEVHINWANVMWDPAVNGGTLTVSAASSDTVNQPVLTVSGYTVTDPITLLPVPAVIGPAGQVVISPLGAPPSKVTVVSTRGGVASLDVTTGVGIPVNPTVPIAVADAVTTPEDVPVTVNVLANDTLAGLPLDPLTATVTISGPGRLGTATLNANGTIAYAPNLNANGTDLVGYQVTVPCATCLGGVATSREGYLTIVITPVNDPPAAINDNAGGANNRAVTINLLANDTDPDGAADLAAAVIVSLPLPAAGLTLTCNGGVPVSTVPTTCAGGLVTVTPTAPGAYSFTYQAQDLAGTLSANTANVSVTANSAENIVVTKSIFTAKTWRWTVAGTDNVIAGQTLAIRYDLATPPTYKVGGVCTALTAANNPVIGTAVVDALGNWTYDVLGTSAGLTNPTNTGSNGTGFWCSPPRAIRVVSPLGGTAASNISLK